MKSFAKRIFGIILTLISVASLLLSLYIITRVWTMRRAATDYLVSTSANASGFLENTQETLEVLDKITSDVSLNITTTQTSLLTLARATQDTSDMMGPLINLTGETLPALITSTQSTVNSAMDTARLVDGVMNAISKIPFVSQPYNPEKSLSASLEQISTDLGNFSPQLQTTESDLKLSQANMLVMKKQITEFSKGLGKIQEEVSQVRIILRRYQDQVAKFQTEISDLTKQIPTMVLGMTMGILFFAAWLAILQVYIAYKGLYLLFHPG